MSDALTRKWERILASEGMTPEPTPLVKRRRSQGGIRLPQDNLPGQWTGEDRARHEDWQREDMPLYNAALEDLFHRGDWEDFPPWHQQLIWEHTQQGTNCAEFARKRPKLKQAQVWRALVFHRRRAGIDEGASVNDKKEQATVKVFVQFKEKVRLKGIQLYQGDAELMPNGRAVRIPVPESDTSGTFTHVLVPIENVLGMAVYAS